MDDEQSAKPPPRKRRRWLRWLLYSFLLLLLLVVIFHRPIIHHGARWVAIWLARKQHMVLDLRIKGDIWNRLEVHNVTLQAADTGKAPIERASLDRLVAEYDFWRVVKGDLGGLKLVDVGAADVVITPALDIDPEPPRPLAEKIRAFFSRPLPTPVLRVGRVDLRVKQRYDDVVARGVHADVSPGTEGVVAWERIEIPGLPVIYEGTARVLATSDRIAVSEVAVWPEVRIVNVRAQRPQGDTRAELAVEIALPEGKLSATINPIIDSNAFEARLDLGTQGVSGFAPRFGLTMPLVLDFLSVKGHWRGVPEEPATHSGEVTFSATGRKDFVVPGWVLSGKLLLDEGKLTVADTEMRAAESVLVANGAFDLRKTLGHQGEGPAPLPEGKLDLRLSAPDLQKAAAEFNLQARGQAEMAGTITTTADRAQFEGTVTGKNLGYKDTTLGQVSARVVAALPRTDRPPLAALTANVEADVTDFRSGDYQADEVKLIGNLRELQATLTEMIVIRGENRARVAGTVRLRETGALAGTPSGQFSIDAPNIGAFGIKAGDQPLTATVRGTGSIRIEDGKIITDGQVTASGLTFGDTRLDDVDLTASTQGNVTTVKGVVKRGANELHLNARTQLGAAGEPLGPPVIDFTLNAPALGEFGLKAGRDLITGTARGSGTVTFQDGKPTGDAQFTGSDVAIGEVQLGDVELKASAVAGATTLDAIVKRGRNELQLRTRTFLGAKTEVADPPAIQFSIDAPQLGEFAYKLKGAPVDGALTGTGSIDMVNGLPEGNLKATASNLTIGQAKAGDVVADIVAENGAIVVKSLRADFNANDHLEATGRMELKDKRPYQGAVSLNVRDLAAFQPILDALGEKRRVAGAVQLKWAGKGDSTTHAGDGDVTVRGLRVDSLQITEGRVAATYTPERVDVPEFLVIADQLRATGKLDWVEKRLNLRGLDVQLAGKPVVTGDASVPLDPFGKALLPETEPISASIAARNLDIARVFRELKLPPRVEGTLTATLTASGTLRAPVVKLDASGRGVRMAPPPKKEMTDEERAVYATARGDFDAEASFEQDRFTLNGTIRHADVRPLTVKLDAPLELKPILEGRMPDIQTIPFTASVEMPASSLAVVPKLMSAVARVDGTAAISMRATGTISEPRLSGQITADARLIRLRNASIPPISNLSVRIGLAGNTVTLQRFQGETGGGRFSAGGTVVATNLLEPVVDLRVRTDKVLAVRNDSVLVRVDADVLLQGPFNAGTARGRVELAQSRFNKEIQILPILMPGKPKPVPREVAQPLVVSFPNPPLRDWTFDIAIVTTNEDPFLVRGNLAKGQVMVDLRLQGTGLGPYLVGSASMEQFSAQLPVSRLTTRRGLINFTQENPFEPRLEIESETVIRGYTIIARLEGPASAPRLDLTSEPPLPQQEIVTLLTTGSLAGELGENNSALATRAGLIVLRDLYKKVFKRDLPVPTDEGGDNFFGRFNVDLGAVDSRTGRQEITAQFRVTDRVVIVGDVEMGGGISGRIQYQFRFR